jgi:segregation and condensation protein B
MTTATTSLALEARIEALLFFKGEAVSISYLAELLEEDQEAVLEALARLQAALADRGVVLLRNADEVLLGTAPALGPLIEKAIKEELSRDIGKAGLETLAIVLYKGPVTRADIDHIRGVNSTFILRNLLIRGLVEKFPNPHDQRSFLYRPTFDLLQHLGVASTDELPEREAFLREIGDHADRLKASQTEAEAEDPESSGSESLDGSESDVEGSYADSFDDELEPDTVGEQETDDDEAAATGEFQ